MKPCSKVTPKEEEELNCKEEEEHHDEHHEEHDEEIPHEHEEQNKEEEYEESDEEYGTWSCDNFTVDVKFLSRLDIELILQSQRLTVVLSEAGRDPRANRTASGLVGGSLHSCTCHVSCRIQSCDFRCDVLCDRRSWQEPLPAGAENKKKWMEFDQGTTLGPSRII